MIDSGLSSSKMSFRGNLFKRRRSFACCPWRLKRFLLNDICILALSRNAGRQEEWTFAARPQKTHTPFANAGFGGILLQVSRISSGKKNGRPKPRRRKQ